jgi:hypothetical protein
MTVAFSLFQAPRLVEIEHALLSELFIPLGSYEMWAKENGQELNECPGCRYSFETIVEERRRACAGSPADCPACGEQIYPDDRTCLGCGAIVDRRYRPGTVIDETVEETEVVWSYDYGFQPYGWYNPWDPMVDAAVFVRCPILLI